ncbi:MAG: TrkH family potassium uptake protein [Flavobacteriales bacterium]
MSMHIDDKIQLRKRTLNTMQGLFFLMVTAAVIMVVLSFGLKFSKPVYQLIREYHLFVLVYSAVWYFVRAMIARSTAGVNKWNLIPAYLLLLTLLLFQLKIIHIDQGLFHYLHHRYLASIAILFIFLKEISLGISRILKLKFEPAILMMAAFSLIIFAGAAVLMLPRATTIEISFIDAIFTATSATCITGLTVLDVSQDFTRLGQTIIILLAQAGALGIMTFATFFAIFLQTDSNSFQGNMAMKEVLSVDKLSEIFSTIYKIIFITLLLESVGIINLYFALQPVVSIPDSDKLFVAIFHGISAFCHAGFSNLPNGLMHEGVNESFYFLSVIMVLVYSGSLGFPIVFSYYGLLKRKLIGRFRQIVFKERYIHPNRVINATTAIVIISTLALLIVGFGLVALIEWNGLLWDKSQGQKILHSLFSSVTARSSGFNTVDFASYSKPTILIIILLMWIGAAPVSTGGGIKVTTFSVALLNLGSLLKGKQKVEFRRRRIGDDTIRKSYAVIFLSFIFIGVGVVFLCFFQPHLPILHVVFECFSAYTTTGLSLGITPELNTSSKVVVCLLMFIGRLGTLSILAAIVRNIETNSYEYPSEEIIIT